jgi:hypothetical protein
MEVKKVNKSPLKKNQMIYHIWLQVDDEIDNDALKELEDERKKPSYKEISKQNQNSYNCFVLVSYA